MKPTPIRVEPLSTYLEKRQKSRIYPVTVAGGFVFVAGLPPFDPDTGEVGHLPFARQAEIVMSQMKQCVEAAGATLEQVVKCNVYCTDASYFQSFNEIYEKFFPVDSPPRIFLCVSNFPGPFNVEVDCIAVL